MLCRRRYRPKRNSGDFFVQFKGQLNFAKCKGIYFSPYWCNSSHCYQDSAANHF